LNDHQRGAPLEEAPVKKDSTLDLLTIMSDKVTVQFKVANDRYQTDAGAPFASEPYTRGRVQYSAQSRQIICKKFC